MPPASLRWTAVAALAALGATTLVARQQFRTSVDLVHVPVIVTGRDGVPVTGLVKEDFRIIEEGKPQRIDYFVEGATGERVPVHLGLLLDTSESMERDLRTAAGAAVRFVDQFEEAVDVTFVDFDSSVRLGRFQRPSYPQLFERMRANNKASGGTSLYDALATYLESTLDRPGQHVVLLHTDGGDSTSSITFGRLTDLLRLADVIVYAIGYLDNQFSNQRIPQQMRVNQITRETGGEAFYPSSPAEMDKVFERIRTELAARYTLGYAPAAAPDGKFRKVEVKLTREIKDAKVRTRTGYVAPPPPGSGR